MSDVFLQCVVHYRTLHVNNSLENTVVRKKKSLNTNGSNIDSLVTLSGLMQSSFDFINSLFNI